jgi:hypothetical protein
MKEQEKNEGDGEINKKGRVKQGRNGRKGERSKD